MTAVLVVLVAFALYDSTSAPPASSGPWNRAYPYPLQAGGSAGVVGQSCVESAGYAYCIGGQDQDGGLTSAVYFAQAASSGVGNWTLSSNSYPLAVFHQSCAPYSGYVYCVGGARDQDGDDVASSYFASLSPAGVGNWSKTTSFPIPVDALSCVASVGDLYCVGGEAESSGTNATTSLNDSVWYARLSSSGIGAWSRGSDYPGGIYFPSCAELASFVYCVGGEDSLQTPENSTYYAYLTPSGMGPWTPGPAYPIPSLAVSCGGSDSSLYCVGGFESGGATTDAVYVSQISSSSTLGTWQPVSSYPEAVQTDCVTSAGFLYCIGGFDSSTNGPTGDSYFALLNGTAATSSQSP
jgi:hypothetical protein